MKKKQTLEESQKLTDKYIKDVDSITETKKKRNIKCLSPNLIWTF